MSRSKSDLLSGATKAITRSKKVENNTLRIEYQDGSVGIRLHDTDIITIMEDGRVILDSGGWRTATTKARMNSSLNPYWPTFAICTDSGVWHLYKGAYRLCRFEDGIEISGSGNVKGGSPVTDGKTDRKLKAKVRKYAQLCVSSIPLPKPNNGDCWYCLMKTQEGRSLGDSTKNTEHLDSHMKERYVVPSLVCDALKEAGAGPAYYWEVFGETKMGGNVLKSIERFVYRFILKRFGYAA